MSETECVCPEFDVDVSDIKRRLIFVESRAIESINLGVYPEDIEIEKQYVGMAHDFYPIDYVNNIVREFEHDVRFRHGNKHIYKFFITVRTKWDDWDVVIQCLRLETIDEFTLRVESAKKKRTEAKQKAWLRKQDKNVQAYMREKEKEAKERAEFERLSKKYGESQ